MLLLIYSIGVLLLTSCAGAPLFPTKTIWEVDLVSGVCEQYEIIDPDNFTIKPVQAWRIDKCHGVFGFSTEDTPKVLDWAMDMKTYAKTHCKAAPQGDAPKCVAK